MKRIALLIGLFAFLLTSKVLAQQVDVNAIVERASRVAYYAGKDGRSLASMNIQDSQGRQRKRIFQILRLDIEESKNQKYYVYFKKPADVTDMVYMVWKNINKDDSRWMYLPALDLVKRIAASDKRSRFVGSHFVYEDISGRSINEDKHLLLSQDEKYWTIRNTPKDPSSVEFAYYDVTIRKSDYLPQEGLYYNDQKELIRKVETLEIQDIQGYSTITKMRASDVKSGAFTDVEFANIEYDLGLTSSIFTERYLRRPPVKWLK